MKKIILIRQGLEGCWLCGCLIFKGDDAYIFEGHDDEEHWICEGCHDYEEDS